MPPIYNYRCEGCKETHEEIQSFSEGDAYRKSPQVCPKCGETHKQSTIVKNTTFIQGSGSWFRNGYR